MLICSGACQASQASLGKAQCDMLSVTTSGCVNTVESASSTFESRTATWIVTNPLLAAVHANFVLLLLLLLLHSPVPLYRQHIEMCHVGELDCIHYCLPGVPQASVRSFLFLLS